MRHISSPSPVKKRKSVIREEGMRSTLYNAFAQDFVNFLAPYDDLQTIQLLNMLPASNEDIELVDSVYGPVPKGSMLSYQQRPPMMMLMHPLTLTFLFMHCTPLTHRYPL